MPEICNPHPLKRSMKKVTFNPVLVTVPEEQSVPEENHSLQDRTVLDIPERPFQEETCVTVPRNVQTLRTLHTVPRTLHVNDKKCCKIETCLYSTMIVLMCLLFMYLTIWLLCVYVFRVTPF
jgi:hypothetical protein